MAEDETLDSFFAKKDKVKKKSDKKTRITTDDINQMIEKNLKPKSARKTEKKLEQQEKKVFKNTKARIRFLIRNLFFCLKFNLMCIS